jgi:broad specificity phosphatase PhoE
MSDVLFVRHGETDLAGTFCGHSDPALNPRGRQQVATLVERLAGERIEVVYASDLLRARETAAAVAAAKRISVYSLPELREIGFGEWEGLSWSAVEARDAAYAARWLAEYPALPAPGGEALPEFEARILTTVKMLLRTEARPFAVVSHAGVMRVALRGLSACPEDECFARTKEYCCVIRYSRPSASLAEAAGHTEASHR